MSKPSSFSLRGRKALVAIKDERDGSIVRRQFDRLGIEMASWEPSAAPVAADVILIDDDYLPLAAADARVFSEDCAVIVLLGTETPSRLKLVLDLDPSSFLVKPLRSAGIYAALVMAFERLERTSELKQQIVKMDARLRSRRVVLTAVLQVMQTHALAEPAAFALIRRTAMQQRKTIEQVAAELVAQGYLPRAIG
ncbi:ANTAR domain-containing response regulator [Rhodopseudomonas pseudopalustris]|uniref:Two-component response regulator, AmiR/NasT family, consists of REC and RNA-binding antiterminator (ANTAR) domains n=1 Tax=Rhodopseudomonas pseudopalustris TaxID=1513892 RepID=A0A1H8LTN9_9BRAD|nr:ANTAR domain-containing protein [Rhodopseudomonas pseudopalustris]MBB1091850.1 ANTAR domain-containing protein [Rhodopseudomonas palustris]SEO08420.1 Two-component response regulator, AmiR/NasT family, consists of REC and RNA-binding antiterminator (ANTAR) domains [Rhodopseudomonas pseudopalustris]